MKERDPVREWVRFSDRDWRAARILLDAGEMSGCVFHCQQAVEKRLKALYVARVGKDPPKINSLPKLCQLLSVDLAPYDLDTLVELSMMYSASQYPGELVSVPDEEEKGVALELHRRAAEVMTWLDSLIQASESAPEGQ